MGFIDNLKGIRDFDRSVNHKVLSHDFKSMTQHERFSVAVQLGIIAGLTASCLALARDQQAPSGVDQLYSPSGELVPLDMFGQDEIFYSVQPEFVDLGIVARNIQVLSIKDSQDVAAIQLMEVQNFDGDIFYNIMYKNPDGIVEQKWAVFANDQFYELDLVTNNGKREFTSDFSNSIGEIRGSLLIFDNPKEDAELPIEGFDIVGFLTGANPAFAAESTPFDNPLLNNPNYDPTKAVVVTATPDRNLKITQEPVGVVLDVSGPGDEMLLTDQMPGAFFVEVDGQKIVGEKVLNEKGKEIAVRLAVPDKIFWKGAWYGLNSNKSNQYVAVYGENGEVGVARQFSASDAGDGVFLKSDGRGGVVAMLNGRSEVVMGQSGTEDWIYKDPNTGQTFVVLKGGKWIDVGERIDQKPEAVVVDPVPAPTDTVKQGEGGLPEGAFFFDQGGGVQGIRSSSPILEKEPKFPNSFMVVDCRVDPTCINPGPKFTSLSEAQNYWLKDNKNSVLQYDYILFSNGEVNWVVVKLLK